MERPGRWSRILDDIAVIAMRPLAWVGIPPRAVRKIAQERVRPRKGAIFEYLRSFRGIDPIVFSADPLANIRAKEIAARPAYRIGTPVLFGLEHGLGIKEIGWADASSDGTWTDGPEASVAFRLAADYAPTDLFLFINSLAYLERRPPEQRVEIRVRGHLVARCTLKAGIVFHPSASPPGSRHRVGCCASSCGCPMQQCRSARPVGGCPQPWRFCRVDAPRLFGPRGPDALALRSRPKSGVSKVAPSHGLTSYVNRSRSRPAGARHRECRTACPAISPTICRW